MFREWMKSLAFAVAALVSAVQTVGWVDCCCILICKHHNDPCQDECREKPAPTARECCESSAPGASRGHDARCSHVEPSSEISTEPAASVPVLPTLILDLPPASVPEPVRPCEDGMSTQVRGSPPPLLHLLYRSLLI